MDEQEARKMLVSEASYALLKWWFPTRKPVGEDLSKWTDIAINDARAVVDHFFEKGILKEL